MLADPCGYAGPESDKTPRERTGGTTVSPTAPRIVVDSVQFRWVKIITAVTPFLKCRVWWRKVFSRYHARACVVKQRKVHFLHASGCHLTPVRVGNYFIRLRSDARHQKK